MIGNTKTALYKHRHQLAFFIFCICGIADEMSCLPENPAKLCYADINIARRLRLCKAPCLQFKNFVKNDGFFCFTVNRFHCGADRFYYSPVYWRIPVT